MAYCEDIRRSIDVKAPLEKANEEWTQFVFYTLYLPQEVPGAREAEPDEGFVRLESLGPDLTRVTVDLNSCPQWEDVDDEREIDDARKHLEWVLARYKEFVETGRTRVRKAA